MNRCIKVCLFITANVIGAADQDPTFGRLTGEVDVPLRAGDFVAGYSELLHAAHANSSAERRTGLTMWYYPAWAELPPRSRASIAAAERGGMRSRLSEVRLSHLAAKLKPLEIPAADDGVPPYELSTVVPIDRMGRL